MTARMPLRLGDPLPEGWRWVRLGDITTLIKNKIDPRKFPEELFTLYSFPAYDAGQKPEVVRGSKIGSTKTIVQPGTVLFARLNPRIPRVWLVGEEHVGKAVASTEFLALFPTELVDSQWLQLWLLSPHVREEVRSQVKGATKSRERIPAEQVLSLILPLPPLETQRRIVAWLDEAFSHLQAIKERHAEAEREAAALLPAKLAEVFGRAEKEGWRWVRLGEIATVKSGGTPRRGNPSYWGGDIPWVKISDITSFHVSSTEETITEEGLTSSSAKLFPVGTILFTIFATIGKVAILDIEAATNQAIAGIFNISESLDTQYLAHYLQFAGPQMANRGRGMAQDNINLTMLRSLEVPLPPLETQRRIVEEIEAFEEEARRIQKAQEESRVVLEQLEKSLLAEAFRPERWV